MELLTRLEDIQAQLDKSWPETLEKTLKEFPHDDKDFYIFTFTKWDYHTKPPKFNINHCPVGFYPGSWALPGTTLRKISPKGGWVKIMWTLPEEHYFDLYKDGKMFEDKIVQESIRKYYAGELKQEPKDETYKKI